MLRTGADESGRGADSFAVLADIALPIEDDDPPAREEYKKLTGWLNN